MRAARLHAPRNLRFHEEPMPEPLPGEVLIRVGSVGVCASDVHWYEDGCIGTIKLRNPIVLGHEASGIIAGLGKGATSLKVGQRVAIEPAKPCF